MARFCASPSVTLRGSDFADRGKGPMAQVIEDRKIPILGIGTVDRIRRGKISVRPCTDQISGADVGFADGTVEQFDVILQATGYRPNLRSLLPDQQDAIDDSDTPIVCGGTASYPGLFVCDIPVSIGQFREIAIEANGIARAIQTRSIRTGSPASRIAYWRPRNFGMADSRCSF
jgi:hypothetical protein